MFSFFIFTALLSSSFSLEDSHFNGFSNLSHEERLAFVRSLPPPDGNDQPLLKVDGVPALRLRNFLDFKMDRFNRERWPNNTVPFVFSNYVSGLYTYKLIFNLYLYFIALPYSYLEKSLF